VGETTIGLEELFHVYDAAMRLWADSCLAELAVWLDPSMAGLPREAFQKQPAQFAAPVVTADLLLTAGVGRLMHVEYETRPDDDLVRRMYDYRGRMMREFPGYRLTQHVLVLGSGWVRGYDDVKTFGFALDVRVRYVRDHEPWEFLSNPVLAPFAVLAQGSRSQREQSFAAAIRLLRDSDLPQRWVLLQVTEALARIRLDPLTIERIEKENGMSIQPLVEFYRDTEVGHRLQDLGRAEGREQGVELGREGVLLALLRSRFADGPQVREAARRLAEWEDEAAAVEAIIAASGPGSLLGAEPPRAAGSR
jgi:hypothetical protein